MKTEVEKYLDTLHKWQDELIKLRNIILDCGLNEEFKWMHPCYTIDNKNVVLIHEFKDYCAILFHKGALLKDPAKILTQQTKNVQAERQIRFTNLNQVEILEQTIKDYISEAIQNEKAGLKVKLKGLADFDVPEELRLKFEEDANFHDAFKSLTPGRQKGYLLHFSKPKQSKTRTARIAQSQKRILIGKGLNDCICGHSKRMPYCDGSHKYME